MEFSVGAGIDPKTEMGPLVSEEQFDRVTGYIDAGIREGAKVAVGGKRYGDRGYFVQPTVLTNTKPDMKVVREEIFGPVVCAESFSDNDLDRVAERGEQHRLRACLQYLDTGPEHGAQDGETYPVGYRLDQLP